MTPPRHGRETGQDGPYDPGAYEAAGAFEAAVDQLVDPLNDPLPGRHASPPPQPTAQDPRGQAPQGPQAPQEPPPEWYDPEGYERDWYGRQGPVLPPAPASGQPPVPTPAPTPPRASVPAPAAEPPLAPRTEETVALRTADLRRTVADGPVVPAPRPEPEPLPVSGGDEPAGEGHSGAAGAEDEPVTGGRAERRRAAKGRGRRRGEPAARPGAGGEAPAKPMSRVEARRAAKAAKDSPAVVISRVVGELFISLGVLMLLFVTYQLWWTNVRADQIAGRETHKIQDDWAKGGRKPEAFQPGEGFAIIHIPKLDVVTPIAEGTSKEKVLDRGMVGHYGEEPLRTAMPSAKQGNFALAGHRNTHGEPFRYINRLRPGDPIVVETREAYYTYEMVSVLPQTSPSNVSVIGPVPPQSGFTKPGRYITLTTCTPEFTSTYRLIVWGKMVDERPRSKGKPDVLVG
ncbi:class E sortase [Streptomyces sp. ITFR-16]|uniref:class E sortase n=1 Tax=Streptomyces sp. ITFR-16 TaxID=3075198 RepID=UPI00288BABBF|nr:class E sortase [Streptomyces sp. ITFR-16]WNI23722.1 class E sortase [Streptomyces sp. ITFR-16]